MISLLLFVKVDISVFIQFPHFSPITSCLLSHVPLLLLWTLFRCLTLFRKPCLTLMIEKMDALNGNGTWNLVQLPTRKKAIGCCWVFAVKVNPDGSVIRLKARLVAKGYA